MNRYIVFSFLFLLFGCISSETGQLSGFSSGTKLALTGEGVQDIQKITYSPVDNTYVVIGTATKQINYGNSQISLDDSSHLIVSKLNSSLRHLWTVSVAGSDFIRTRDVVVSKRGHVYFGYYRTQGEHKINYYDNFGRRKNLLSGSVPEAGFHFLKLSSNGEILRRNSVSMNINGNGAGSTPGLVAEMGVDSNESVYFGGFMPKNGVLDHPLGYWKEAGINNDLFFGKLNSAFEFEFLEAIGGEKQDRVWGIDVTDDQFVITAYVNDQVYYQGTNLTPADGRTHGLVLALSPRGDYRWHQVVQNIGSGATRAYDACTSENNKYVFITGFTSANEFKLGNLSSSGTISNDIYIAKLDKETGQPLKLVHYKQTGSDLGLGVECLSDSTVSSTGYFTGSSQFDSLDPITSAGSRDGYYVRLTESLKAITVEGIGLSGVDTSWYSREGRPGQLLRAIHLEGTGEVNGIDFDEGTDGGSLILVD